MAESISIPLASPPILSVAGPDSQTLLLAATASVAFGALLTWLVALVLSRTRLPHRAVKIIAAGIFPALIASFALIVQMQPGRSAMQVLQGLPLRTYASMGAMFAFGWWIAARTLRRGTLPLDPKVFD